MGRWEGRELVLPVALLVALKSVGSNNALTAQYVHKIAPRGVYTSGKGSSAVGLTAYITRDPDSKQLVLERWVGLRKEAMGTSNGIWS